MANPNDFNQTIMKDLQGFFRAGERTRLYNAATNIRDRLLIRLLWKTGRRVSEILMLKVKEIDFENKDIIWHIEKKTKTKKDELGETVWKANGEPERIKVDMIKRKPIDNFTLQLLAYFIKSENLQSEDYIFGSNQSDTYITRQRAFQIVRECAARSGIHFVGNKKPHPHHFRHSLAVDIAKRSTSPADIRKLQMLLEHTSLDMTMQYLQFGDQDIREMIEEDYD